MNHKKYCPRPRFDFPQRTWPEARITAPPVWCSVDLRDGNQALEVPMDLDQKLEFFKLLCRVGFKEIEIGFPAASDTEYILTRRLIEDALIPQGVAIQVLTQAREHIMERTFEALSGVQRAIVHLYNSTSKVQREVVFNKSKEEIISLAAHGAAAVLSLAERHGRERFMFEYSPESFTATEPEYAAQIINAVLDIWRPCAAFPCIVNLPSTVETTSPNVYADIVEYICNSINPRYKQYVIISLHTHNDRGCAIAASELGLLAGATRIEGTLFGNGERTGNADILTLALNLYSQGIDPGLDFSDINALVTMYEKNTLMNVHERHPYAGALVFTAFSGSHQDAINKALSARAATSGETTAAAETVWDIPYLPIDPADIGRDYEAIIRINSQSGKGGVAFILERKYGLTLPKPMRQEFAYIAKKESDREHKELIPAEVYALFEREYINLDAPVSLVRYTEQTCGDTQVSADILINGEPRAITGAGDGLIDAFTAALKSELSVCFEIESYNEHSLEYGAKSRAITYIHIKDTRERSYFGAGVSSSISKSSLKAVVSAVNRLMKGC